MTAATSTRFASVAPQSARNRVTSDVAICGGLAYVNGVGPADLANDRAPLPEMVEAQTQRIFANLDAMLAAAGIQRRELVCVQVRLVDFDRLIERMDMAYARGIGDQPMPTRSCSGVARLTRGALVEMDFIVRTGN
jgi:enamine deaminase RidA (YjgF/YER057c/UK114 family)